MTIKQLKEELEQYPDDSIAYFTLWTANGERMYWFNPTCDEPENRTTVDSEGRSFTRIAHASDCLMNSLRRQNKDHAVTYNV